VRTDQSVDIETLMCVCVCVREKQRVCILCNFPMLQAIRPH